MTERAWRYISLLLVVAVAILWWRDCHRPRGAGHPRDAAETSLVAGSRAGRSGSRTPAQFGRAPGRPGDEHGDEHADEHGGEPWDDDADEPPMRGPSLTQQLADHWAVRFLTPHPGESILDYRDRVVPVAQLAVAPHRKRVAESRRRFAEAAALDARQQQVLDTAVQRAADDIKDQIMQGVLSGALLPPRVRPASAVAFARDVLDLLDRANREFRDALSHEQRAHLDAGGFDVIDYLFFSTRWEDVLGVVE